VLCVSTLYPNIWNPGAGIFVRYRLQAASALAELRVIAPWPRLQAGRVAAEAGATVATGWSRDAALRER
jgi:hypothetical protein